jgi:F-type H+-transporting ATPase subunit delta
LSSKSTFSNATSKSYALALFEISMERTELDKVENEMKSLHQLLNTNPDFKDFIVSPTISPDNKKSVVDKITTQNNFSKTSQDFLGFVSIKNRLFFLNKIIDSFLVLLSKNRGELKAKLISSKELSKEDHKKIEFELSESFKSNLNIEYKYDPSLIAGLIIQVGSIMVDTSIKSKLKRLETKMVEA